MDSRGAMFDERVTSITFFNYKILSDEVLPEKCWWEWNEPEKRNNDYHLNKVLPEKCWWMWDELEKGKNDYHLKMEVEAYDDRKNILHRQIEIRFEQLEVERHPLDQLDRIAEALYDGAKEKR